VAGARCKRAASKVCAAGGQVRAAELGAPYKEVARRGARAAEAAAAAAAAAVRVGACVHARGRQLGAGHAPHVSVPVTH